MVWFVMLLSGLRSLNSCPQHSAAAQRGSTAQHHSTAAQLLLLLCVTSYCCSLLFPAVCCCWLLFVTASLDLLRFAAFCYLCSPRVVPKCSPEATKCPQNGPKIDPKWPLGAPWGPQVEPKSYFVMLGSILEPNLVPKGTPKSTKNR